jgi:signal transduction histidine kinase
MHASPDLPGQLETIAELRELYRAAEARAARLRLLSSAGRELALCDEHSLQATVQTCADRLAHFLGRPGASLNLGTGAGGLPLLAPGPAGDTVGSIHIDGIAALADIDDEEDREATSMVLELISATVLRIDLDQERSNLLETLREREQTLESLLSRLFSAQEDERRRLSRELHDGLAQSATALMRMLEGGTANVGEPLLAPDRARLASIARNLVAELRSVIAGLRPTLLDDLGLTAAIRAVADELERDGYSVSVTLEDAGAHWPPHVETALFRVAQEAAANIRKHAGGPCPVDVRLSVDKDGTTLLRISDHGRGPLNHEGTVCARSDGTRVGVAIMRERITSVGGVLSWTADTKGVAVTAVIPRTPAA